MAERKPTYIKRQLGHELVRLRDLYAVIMVTGPRHSGKTTLCRNHFPDFHCIHLGKASVREQIQVAPKVFLEQYVNGLILDEVQHFPELLSYIQIIADEHENAQYILTASSDFALMQHITPSLAGRAAILTLLPLSLSELGNRIFQNGTNTLLLNGGHPAVWAKKISVQDATQNYYNTYIQRGVRQLLNVKDMTRFQTFIRLCAGRIGTACNASVPSNEIDVSIPTIQRWFNVLEASYIIFRLPPFFRNIGKRLVKTPKMYFYDTGLACFLMGIENEQQLSVHPLRGALFENMVVLEFYKNRCNHGKLPHLYFYRDKSQNEVDLIEEKGGKLYAYEIKSAKAFTRRFVKGLEYLRTVVGNDVVSTQVLYDGENDMNSAENGMLNFRNLHLPTG